MLDIDEICIDKKIKSWYNNKNQKRRKHKMASGFSMNHKYEVTGIVVFVPLI